MRETFDRRRKDGDEARVTSPLLLIQIAAGLARIGPFAARASSPREGALRYAAGRLVQPAGAVLRVA